MKSNTFTRTGYQFAGWTTNSDGSGMSYINGQSIGNLAVTQNANIMLFAKWTEEQYEITYNDVGGIAFSGTHGAEYPTFHIYGSVTTLLNSTKTGYVFDGWYLNSDGASQITTIGTTDYTETFTLYAKWSAAEYLITFNKQSGSNGSENVLAIYNQSMPSATAPMRDGHSFGGYFSAINGSGTQYYDTDMVSVQNWDLAYASELHAYWVVIRVSSVTIEIASTLELENSPFTLMSTVLPTNALNNVVTYTLLSAGTTGATISGNVLTVSAEGTLIIKASVDGISSEQITITVIYTKVYGVEIANDTDVLLLNTPTLIKSSLFPDYTVAKNQPTFEMTPNTCGATINENGCITAITGGGRVRVRATVDGERSNWFVFNVPSAIITLAQVLSQQCVNTIKKTTQLLEFYGRDEGISFCHSLGVLLVLFCYCHPLQSLRICLLL